MPKNHLPSIYYACTLPIRAGGEVVNWQHVDGLRKLGYRAFALLDPNSRVGLPRNPYSVPMVHWGDNLRFTEDDWIVVPEVFPPQSFKALSGMPSKIVIHNQNPFYSFRGFSSMDEMNRFPLAGGLCCSNFTRDTLLGWGSTVDWQVVRPQVLDVFSRNQVRHKKKQIAFMPRKRPEDVNLLRGVFLSIYPEHADVPWIEIKDMSRSQVAQNLGESLVFASFSKNEGLGLPPLEAMASGCLVCGFHGEGGQEYASEQNGWWVPDGNWTRFAHALNAALTCSHADIEHRRAVARQTVVQFSEAQFVNDLSTAWSSLLKVDDRYFRAKIQETEREISHAN